MVARCRRARILAPVLVVLLGAAAAASAQATPVRLARVAHARATPRHATLALRPRNPRALAAYAAAVSTPGSPEYHRYLTVAQFAARFAPTAAQRRLVRAALRRGGFGIGATSPNGLSIALREPTGPGADALSDGSVAAAAGHIGGAAGKLVQGVVGLDAAAPSASVIVRRRAPISDALAVSRRRASAVAAGPQACGAAQAAATDQGGFTADQIASRYGLSTFYAAGDEGRGITVALYELEPFSASDVAAYQACMGTSATVETEAIAGGAGVGSGSGEAAMDVEDLIGLVPRATIRVYEGPQTAAGAYATYTAIVADDSAQVVSTSWGLCEAQLGSVAAQAEDVLFQEAAAQGQTVVAASGDSGADDCGNGTRGVDDPSSQPWVTGVGGTSAHGTTDTVWNDSLGASGGGASTLWPRPAWQTAAVAQSAVSCGAAGTACREVPDISADADPSTGYAAFYRGAWRTVGGTSVAAPTIAALAALTDASPACAGHPLGFLAPALYTHAAQIADVSSGTNTFGGVPGFSAAPGYDMASGLGTPTAALGPALCGDAVSLGAVGAQSLNVGRAVSLDPAATSAKRAAITWTATGLPAGLAISPETGRITGSPRSAGHATVTLTARDADGGSATTSFPVTVAAASNASSAVARAQASAHHRRHTRSSHTRTRDRRDRGSRRRQLVRRRREPHAARHRRR